jgi:hypothetical protein
MMEDLNQHSDDIDVQMEQECFDASTIPFGGHADYFSAPGLTAYPLVEP